MKKFAYNTLGLMVLFLGLTTVYITKVAPRTSTISSSVVETTVMETLKIITHEITASSSAGLQDYKILDTGLTSRSIIVKCYGKSLAGFLLDSMMIDSVTKEVTLVGHPQIFSFEPQVFTPEIEEGLLNTFTHHEVQEVMTEAIMNCKEEIMYKLEYKSLDYTPLIKVLRNLGYECRIIEAKKRLPD